MDTLTPAERSERMRGIRSKDTKPEMRVRRLVHGMGYRYRLHDRRVPGTPDLVFRRRRRAIFVHGCYWHGHDCKLGRLPKSRLSFWREKIAANRRRDARVRAEMQALGWSSLVLWECELRDEARLASSIKEFLNA
jgi:DNA mismatch endonuclease (patch repair protein)